MFSYRTQQKFSNDFIENQFYDFFILRKEGIDIKDIKIQEAEVQAIKFVDINELMTMCDKKIPKGTILLAFFNHISYNHNNFCNIHFLCHHLVYQKFQQQIQT